MTSVGMADQAMLLVLAAILGFLAKILWDWLNSRGRDEKGLFMTKTSCRTIREDCGIKEFKKEYADYRNEVDKHSAKIDQQLCGIDKALIQANIDAKLLRKDISEIKETLSGLLAVMGMRKANRTENND